jgi:NAD(P)-dependent dehydrogenase (short-subunit alcohol dehydrogenase family)
MRPLVETAPAAWEPLLRVNLYGVMHVTLAALPAMIEADGGGQVVTVISDAGRVGEPHLAAYAAAKVAAAGQVKGEDEVEDPVRPPHPPGADMRYVAAAGPVGK